MRRLLAVVAIVAVAAGCKPPPMMGGGWAWDPSPAHPITVDNRSGLDLSAVSKWNDAAGTTIFAVLPAGDPAGVSADVVFEPLTPICPLGDCTQRRHMWVQVVTAGPFVTHCVIHYDPTFRPGDPSIWSPNVVAHEPGHCLDYPDDPAVPAPEYRGVMSYERFYDPAWQAAWWWGPDDREMLARDGYGP